MESNCEKRARTHYAPPSVLANRFLDWFNAQLGLASPVKVWEEVMSGKGFSLFDFGDASISEIVQLGYQLGVIHIASPDGYAVFLPAHFLAFPTNLSYAEGKTVLFKGNAQIVCSTIDAFSRNSNWKPVGEILESNLVIINVPNQCRGDLFLFAMALGRSMELFKNKDPESYSQIGIGYKSSMLSSNWDTFTGLDLKTCSFEELEAWEDEQIAAYEEGQMEDEY